jgi:hypothetical protein
VIAVLELDRSVTARRAHGRTSFSIIQTDLLITQWERASRGERLRVRPEGAEPSAERWRIRP